MYHKIEDQEKHAEKYVLTEMNPSFREDECFDLISKPRQTQNTLGFYLKEIKDSDKSGKLKVDSENERVESEMKRKFSGAKGSHELERALYRNKGFWVDKPQIGAPLTYKLRGEYTVNIPQRSKKGQGIFCRPDFMELDYVKKLADAGLLYQDEEISDSEEEIEPDDTSCLPLRKTRYKICDPCKTERKKKEEEEEGPPKDLVEEIMRRGKKPPFKKIPSGCQCDFFGEHNKRPTVWDNPFEDPVDMLRQHEMNKVMRPYKCELLRNNYEQNPPIKFRPHEPGAKRTFPDFS